MRPAKRDQIFFNRVTGTPLDPTLAFTGVTDGDTLKSEHLFFDQMDDMATRQMFADKLIIYDGRHLSTVLFTGLSEDYSRPRPMTADERAAFLKTIFKASGW